MITTSSEYNPTSIIYPPKVYSNISEFQALSVAYDKECRLIMKRLESIYKNRFFFSLDNEGCSRWEKMMKIKVNSSYTLDDRRFTISTKYTGSRPYTEKRVRKLLEDLVGSDNYTFNIDYIKKHAVCKINLGVKHQLAAVVDLMENILPLNITYDAILLYNTHEILAQFTHEQLSHFTHEELREMPVEKMKERLGI
ncbi:putative phage tail protein [Peptostreptococcus faecalis]|uniref:putative phage tail protein n=1 Tax=Peptostreptococcus faecalis TaxID=2045015 RepID=UPI0015E06E2E|nr:putative phage tail protein [Peptostreptococcus faecalis]